MSPYGDAFTLMGLFEEWLRIKQERGGSSYKARGRAGGPCARGGAKRRTPAAATVLLQLRAPLLHPGTRAASVRARAQWAKRAGIEEQRLYEMAKLRTQFQVRAAPHAGAGAGLRRRACVERAQSVQCPWARAKSCCSSARRRLGSSLACGVLARELRSPPPPPPPPITMGQELWISRG